MIYLDFLSKTNNKLLNEFYELTDGNIVLGGSCVLKLNNIIDRKVGNLNLILHKSHIAYFADIVNKYHPSFISNQTYGLINKTYWVRKYGVNAALFLCDDLPFDVFLFNGNRLKVATIDDVKYNKEELIKNGDSNSLKHFKDVQLIDNFNGIKYDKSII